MRGRINRNIMKSPTDGGGPACCWPGPGLWPLAAASIVIFAATALAVNCMATVQIQDLLNEVSIVDQSGSVNNLSANLERPTS